MAIGDAIRSELEDVERACNVRVLLAVEAGSRAWGTASADSDYDVRFVYVRRGVDYLCLERFYGSFKDTIDWKLEGEYDIVGWDLAKFLTLLRNSNPSAFEWVASPIVYWEDPCFAPIRELAPSCFSRIASAFKYLSKADHDIKYLERSGQIQLKSYLSLVQALLMARWSLDHNSPPPSSFAILVESEMEVELRPVVESALQRKVQRTGKDQPVRIPELDEWAVRTRTEIAKRGKGAPGAPKVSWDALDAVFLGIVMGDDAMGKRDAR